MLIHHVLGLLIHPQREWPVIRERDPSIRQVYLQLLLVLALLPPFAAFVGTTQIGWRLGWGAPVKLTAASALPLALLSYLAILTAVFIVGKAIHWMAVTYGAAPTLSRCVTLAAFTATPLLLLGFVQFYPLLWLNFLIGLAALAYTVYLLYSGVPVMMEISPERGFLFSSAVLTFGLVAFVALLTVTVLLWGVGLAPEYSH